MRYFEERSDRFGDNSIVRPIAARREQIIEFFLADRAWYDDLKTGVRSRAPAVLAAGPFTRRNIDLILRGHLHKFTIQFTPTGFHALFGLPMVDLADTAVALGDVLSNDRVSRLWHRLGEAPSFAARVGVAEDWLGGLVGDQRPGPIADAAGRLSKRHGAAGIAALAASCALSPRQFERRFAAEVGVPPKLWARILRFQRALDGRLAAPEATWASIAQDAGYFDQAHMIRDFRDLAETRPSSFVNALAPAHERVVDQAPMSQSYNSAV